MKIVIFGHESPLKGLDQFISPQKFLMTTSIEEVKSFVSDNEFVFLFIDIDDAEGLGVQLNAECKTSTHLKRIVYSGHFSAKDFKKHQFSEDAAEGYLKKPFDTKDIIDLVEDFSYYYNEVSLDGHEFDLQEEETQENSHGEEEKELKRPFESKLNDHIQKKFNYVFDKEAEGHLPSALQDSLEIAGVDEANEEKWEREDDTQGSLFDASQKKLDIDQEEESDEELTSHSDLEDDLPPHIDETIQDLVEKKDFQENEGQEEESRGLPPEVGGLIEEEEALAEKDDELEKEQGLKFSSLEEEGSEVPQIPEDEDSDELDLDSMSEDQSLEEEVPEDNLSSGADDIHLENEDLGSMERGQEGDEHLEETPNELDLSSENSEEEMEEHHLPETEGDSGVLSFGGIEEDEGKYPDADEIAFPEGDDSEFPSVGGDSVSELNQELSEDEGSDEIGETTDPMIEDSLDGELEELEADEESLEDLKDDQEGARESDSGRDLIFNKGDDFAQYSDDQLVRFKATIRELRIEREDLLQKIENNEVDKAGLHQKNLGFKAEIDELKIELEVLKQRHYKELEESRTALSLANRHKSIIEEKSRHFRSELEEVNQKFRVNFSQVKRREQELESKLELVSMDSASQLKTRDEKILDLKRKIDSLEFNMESLEFSEKKSKKHTKELEQKLSQIMKTLKSSLNQFQEEDSFSNPKIGSDDY